MQPVTALQFFGVVAARYDAEGPLTAGSELVTFRDLGAVVAPCEYELPDDAEARHYRRVVESVFRRQEILPAPPGVVFRSRDVLAQWLELHYFTLLDALVFVEERAMARVTVHRSPHRSVGSLADEASNNLLQDSIRVLRRHAAATVAFGGEEPDALTAMSFLVQQDRWELFTDLVREESDRLTDHTLDLSGPWPPYDFIRMQFSN